MQVRCVEAVELELELELEFVALIDVDCCCRRTHNSPSAFTRASLSLHSRPRGLQEEKIKRM